jgi:CheY-like chemotaxis protein
MHYTRAALRCTRHGTVHIGVSLAAQDATSVKLRFAAYHSTNAASGDGNAKAAARRRNMEGTMGRATDRARADNFWFNALLKRVAASATEAPEGRCAPHAPARSSLLDAVRGARILLVDAHAEHQQAAQELLESAGFAVALADNGQQALFRIDQSTRGRCPFDLVLMDLQMPVLDGISAVRLLRSMPQFGLLPIVAMGANAGQAQRLLCLRAGMNDLLGKPLLPQALGQALQRWIRPRRGLGLEADPEAGRNAGRTVGREIGRTGVRNAGRDGSPDGVRDAGQGSATRTPETRWQAWPPAPYLPSPPPWPSTPPGPV